MDRTLHGWSKHFENINKNWVGMYEADIINDYRRIDKYGLPAYKKYFYEVSDLMSDFSSFEKKFDFSKCYIQLYPKKVNLPKLSQMDFTSAKAIYDFVFSKIRSQYSDYIILISEYEPNKYGGSVMSNGETVYIEMCRGLQNQISYGNSDTIGCSLIHGEIHQWHNASEPEKQIIRQILSALNILSDSTGSEYLQGYFEFAVTESINNPGKLRLVFIDYKDDQAYVNI
jgi:hypothetical protein